VVSDPANPHRGAGAADPRAVRGGEPEQSTHPWPGSEAGPRLAGRPARRVLAGPMAQQRRRRGGSRLAAGAEEVVARARSSAPVPAVCVVRGAAGADLRRCHSALAELATGRDRWPALPGPQPRGIQGSGGVHPAADTVGRRSQGVGRGQEPDALPKRPDRRRQGRRAGEHHGRGRLGAVRRRGRRAAREPGNRPRAVLPVPERAGHSRRPGSRDTSGAAPAANAPPKS